MRYLITLLLSVLLVGCGTSGPERSIGGWTWIDPVDGSRGTGKAVTEGKFSSAKASCDLESRQVSIPGADCSMQPGPDCTALTGFNLEWCQVQQPTEHCDYGPVRDAKEAKRQAFDNCMNLSGWARN